MAAEGLFEVPVLTRPRAAARSLTSHRAVGARRQNLLLALGVALALVALPAFAGPIQSVTPLGASAGVSVRVTATGLDPVPANNEVLLRLADGSLSRVEPASVSTLDASRDLRRLTFVVPAGLAVGTAALSVVNRTTAVESATTPFEVIAVAVAPTTLAPGQRASLRITGSPNAQFVPGRTLVTVGAGVTVDSTLVESATSLLVGVTVAAAADLGPRTIAVVSSLHQAVLPGGLSVAVEPPPPNRAPTANAGGPYAAVEAGVAVTFDGRASSDADGDALTYAWDFGDGHSSTSPTPLHAFAVAGAYLVTLTVTDPAGARDSDTVEVTVLSPADRAPPTLALAAPSTAVPGSAVQLVASAADDSGQVSVRFDLDGEPAAELTAPPYAFTLSIPDLVAAGRRYVVRATARDQAGNTTTVEVSISVSAEPDTTSPTVGLAGPPATAPGAVVTLVAHATDEVGVAHVVFLAGDVELARDTVPPFEASYLVPPDATIGSTLRFTARAFDFSGNVGEANLDVPVTGAADHEPPSVSLTAPGQASPGERITLSALASDASGIGSVVMLVGGRPIATLATPPFEASYLVPGDALPGTSLTLSARATDFAGNRASATRLLQIAAPATSTRAIVTGEVYDDTTGFPLAFARVRLVGTDALDRPYDIETSTDAQGRYLLRGTAGQGRLRIGRDGWTSVDRPVALVAGAVVEVFDARLTPYATPAGSAVANLGGELSSGRAGLLIPPGFPSSPALLRMATVSGQGLQGLLPPGWSPLAAVDIAPRGVSLAGVTVRFTHGVAPGSPGPIVLARWDETSAVWRVVDDGRVSDDGLRLEAEVAVTGQYAWLVADTQPVAPPTAVAGEVLGGVAVPIVPGEVASEITPQPRVIFYEPGIRSSVTGTVVATQGALTSGARLWAKVRERYRFLSGAEMSPEPRIHDLVFYQSPGSASTLSATHVVSPTQRFEALSLDQGVITVELLVPPAALLPPGIAGVEGGTFDGPAGESLVVAPGALPDATPVMLATLDLADLGVPLPAGVDLLAGVQVSLGRELSLPGVLSMPAPGGATDPSRLLFARLAEVAGRTRLVLVAAARLANGRVVSELTVGGQPTSLPGVREIGRYLLVHVPSAPGFADGVVRGVDGTPFAGALVTAGEYPLVALSNTTGGYTAAGTAGAVTLGALDPDTRDAGSAPATLAAGTLRRLDLALVAERPRVVSTRPQDGAVHVALSDPILVTFSEPVDPASVAGANAARFTLAPEGGARLDGVLSLTNDNTLLTFRPAAPLAPDTRYRVTIAREITDTAGYQLAADVSFSFESLDTSPPPVPPAGAITADIPSASGTTTVTATQGTAGPRDSVWIRNRTTGARTPVLVEADGGFSAIVPAGPSDVLDVVIIDVGGNETIVEVPRFRREYPDGGVSVAMLPEGGVVEGPGGAQVDVPVDALPAGAIVTLAAVPISEIPVDVSGPVPVALDTSMPPRPHRYELRSAVRVDFGGATPARHVNLSFPARGDEAPGDNWIVARLAEIDGQPALAVVDTAKLRDGRIVTASPPYPGVTASGTYVVVRSDGPTGTVHGQVAPADSGVDLRFSVLTSNPAFDLVETLLPFWATSSEPRRMGFPMPAGRVSITDNSVRLRVEPNLPAPSDRELLVRNLDSGQVQSFPLVPIDYRVQVPWALKDRFEIKVSGPAGEQVVTGARLTAAEPAGVVIRLDPDRIAVPVTRVTVRNLDRDELRSFDFALPIHDLGVAGGVATPRRVDLVSASGQVRTLAAGEYLVRPSDHGEGALLLHVAAGALASGYPVTKVTLQGPGGFAKDVPAAGIVELGTKFAFDGPADGDYLLAVEYAGRPTHYVPIPRFRLTVLNAVSGDVVRTISGFVPPPDEPLDLGTVSDDVSLPYVVSGPVRTGSFDPSAPLTVTFSESMDAQSLKDHIHLVDSRGRRVEGEVRVSDRNRVAAFVPARPLKLGESYVLVVEGIDPAEPWSPGAPGALPPAVRDAAGNPLFTLRLQVRTFTPRSLGTFASAAPFKDIAVRRRSDGATSTTTLFVTTGGQADNLVALDVTTPQQPLWLSAASAAMSQQRITVLPDVTFTDRTGRTFTGDLAVTAQFNVNFASMTFFDVTDRAAPTVLASKVLTVNPDLMTGPNPGNTVFATAYAKGIAAVPTTTGAAAFAAVEKMGVMAAEVGPNVPQRAVHERLREPVYPGSFTDVVTHAGQLYAVSPSQPAEAFVVLSPNLAPLGAARLSYVPRRLRVAPGLQADLNGDGLISPAEVFDLAIVGGDFGVSVVDVRDSGHPIEIAQVPVPGVVRDVEYDPGTRRAFVGADLSNAGPTLLMIDLSRPMELPVDADADGFDDRIQFRRSYPNGFNGIRLDGDRGLLYIAHPAGLDVWGVYDSCCDLGVDLTAAPDRTRADGDLRVLLKKEKQALQKGIAAGIREAVARCGVAADDFRMWESGSSACLWADDPVKVCDGNYQPGLSDHDISTYFPDGVWGLPEIPSEVDEDGNPDSVRVPVCIINRLTEQFTDANGKALPITVEGDEPGRSFTFHFHDISFLPDRLHNVAIARYSISRTDPALKGDAVNDMALGRQLLMLKHVTESRWVQVPGFPDVGKPTYPANYLHELDPADADQRNIDFEDSLRKMRTKTGIPSLEGYEWTKLMEWMFAKGKGFLRIPGAEDERSAFHDLYVVQMHLAGKAGIRAALARTIADPRGSRRTIDLVRSERALTEPVPDPTKTPDGRRATVVFEKNACLYVDPAVAPAKWLTKPCNSLEEYMASAAAWTLRPWRDEEPLDIFTLEDVLNIYTFYQVKADRISITDPLEAHRFVAKVARYLRKWQAEALPTWLSYTKVRCPDDVTSYAECDPYAPGDGKENDLRTDNLLTQQRELQKALTAHLGVVPHVYNRSYRDALGVTLTSRFRAPGASSDTVKAVPIDLEGGDHLYPEWETDQDGNVKIEKGKKVPLFMFDIDQGEASRGKTGRGLFTIDLPGRRVRESDRTNNYTGFAYYVLDPNSDTPPDLPALEPDLPAGSLEPDLECTREPALSISQQLEVRTTTPSSPIEPVPVLRESPVVMALRQSATLKLTVTNPTAEAIDQVTACTSLTSRCYPVGTLAAGQSVTTDVPFTATAPAVIDAVPTVYSATTSLATAPPFRIVVGCPRPVIAPMVPDPNPVGADSKVMLDGTSYRHYRVIDRSTGAPLPGVPVTALTTGASLATYAFTTGVDGTIGKWRTQGDATEFVPGVAIPFVNGMAEGPVQVRLEAGGEERAACGDAEPVIYSVDFVPGEFSEGIRAGSEISTGLSALGGKVTLGAGGGLSFTVDSRRHSGQATPERGALFFNRKISGDVKGEWGFKTFSFQLDGLAKAEGPKGVAGVGVGLTFGDRFTFALTRDAVQPVVEGDLTRFRDLVLDPLAPARQRNLLGVFSDLFNGDPWWQQIRRLWFDKPVEHYRPVKVSDFTRISGTAQAEGKVFDAKVLFTEIETSGGDIGQPKYDGASVVSAKASATAKIGVAYEIERQFADATSRRLTGLVPSVTGEGEFELKANLSTLLDTILAEMEAETTAETTVRAEVEKWTVKQLAARLARKWGADGYGGMRLSLVLGTEGTEGDPVDPLRWGVKRIDVTFLSRKPFGYVKEGQPPKAPGARYTLTYSVASKAQMLRVLQHVAAFKGLLHPDERARLGLDAGPVLVGPSELLEAFMRFVRQTLENASYTEAVDTGKAIASFDLGLGGDIFGNGAEIKVNPLSVDSTVSFVKEKGVLVGGRAFVLEDYQSLGIAATPWYELLFQVALREQLEQANQQHAIFAPTVRVPGAPGSGGTVGTTLGGTLTFRNDEDFATAKGTLGHGFVPIHGPVAPAPYYPADTTGPAAKPHYGVGGFHGFTPDGAVLGAAAGLAIGYTDEDVAGVDERQLRLFRWDGDRGDWTLVDGQVLPDVNMVTASVDRLGTYTLAPPMPAGPLAWSVISVAQAGSGLDTKTVARLRTAPLVRNDGQPVAAGTIVHVSLQPEAAGGADLASFGRVLTADAQPEVEGAQVVVGADGCVEIEIEVPGTPDHVRVISFSDVGTAGGNALVALWLP